MILHVFPRERSTRPPLVFRAARRIDYRVLIVASRRNPILPNVIRCVRILLGRSPQEIISGNLKKICSAASIPAGVASGFAHTLLKIWSFHCYSIPRNRRLSIEHYMTAL
jgi:hypothetical protein